MPAAVNGMKECTICGETKDVSEYGKTKRSSDGRVSSCSACRRQYYEDNKESYRARGRQHRQDNREEIAAKRRHRYYSDEEYRERRRRKAKDWKLNNKEAVSAAGRKWYQENKEAISARHRKWYQENKEDIRVKSKASREAVQSIAAAAVYEIENRITGKAYVGQSTAWESRWTRHKNMLSDGSHSNSSLQADYDEYGLDAFEHRVIQEYPCDTPPDVLKEHERQVLVNRIREGKEVYNSLC